METAEAREPVHATRGSAVAANAFRMLGTGAAATKPDLDKALSAFRRNQKLGVTRATLWDVPLLGDLQRTEGSMLEAFGRLTNVERRTLERVFWFESLDENAEATSAHDKALLSLSSGFLADPAFAQVDVWNATILQWRAALADDAYWNHLLDVEHAGRFEPPANGDDIRLARSQALQLSLAPIAEATKEAIARNDEAVAGRALAIVRAIGEPELVFTLETAILAPVEEGVTRLSEAIATECVVVREPGKAQAASNKPICERATARLMAEALPRLRFLERIAGADSIFALRARGDVAESMSRIASDWTWADDFVKSRDMMKSAVDLAAGTPSQHRLADLHEQVKMPAVLQEEKVKVAGSAPPQFSIFGFGVRVISWGNRFAADPRYDYSTLYFTAFWIPLIPLRRYLSTQQNGQRYIHATTRFGIVEWIHVAIGLAVIAYCIYAANQPSGVS